MTGDLLSKLIIQVKIFVNDNNILFHRNYLECFYPCLKKIDDSFKCSVSEGIKVIVIVGYSN